MSTLAHPLAHYLAAWRGFDWRTANCAHFAAGFAAPAALQGVPMPAGAGSLRATLRALGARSLRQAVTMRLGAEISPLLARAGDVVLWRRTLGLCIGRQAALPTCCGAVVFLPMRDCAAAWRAQRGDRP